MKCCLSADGDGGGGWIRGGTSRVGSRVSAVVRRGPVLASYASTESWKTVLTRRISFVVLLLLAVTAAGLGSAATAGAQAVASQRPDPPQSSSAFRAAATAGPVSGGRGAVVITVALSATNDTPATVPDQTPAQVEASVIEASRPWFQQASHGVFAGYSALKRGPITVQTTAPVCSTAWLNQIGDQANAALQRLDPGLADLSRYGAVIYYFGRVDACAFPGAPDGAAGWAQLPAQGNRVWLNGDSSLRTVVHELGHNLGLNHSGSLACADAISRQVPLADDNHCTPDEYGDGYSSMGSSLSDGYSPAQLAQLGWNDGHVLTVNVQGTASNPSARYFLAPAEANGAGMTQALRLLDGATTIWLEYRLPTGNTTPGLNGGLLVRSEQPSRAGSPFLLAMNQPDSAGPFMIPHPQMNVGQSWSNPLGTMQIRLDSADGTGASMTISSSFVPPPPSQVAVPDILGDSRAQASSALSAAGLTLGTQTGVIDDSCNNIGSVLSQTPTAGTLLAPGTAVNVTIGQMPRRHPCP
jgi:hypothetical protein